MTKRTRAPANGKPPADPLADHPAVWLGKTPTSEQLASMPGDWFHQAVDQLQADSVPETYWRKVQASRQAKDQCGGGA